MPPVPLDVGLNRVLEEARRWGLTVVRSVVPFHGADSLIHGVGIELGTSTLFVPEGPFYDESTPCGVMHEISHILVQEDPWVVDEVGSGMLWIDYEAKRRLNLGGWTRWMRDYGVYTHLAPKKALWTELSAHEAWAVLQDSRRSAQEAGLVDAEGAPTYSMEKILKMMEQT